MPHFHHSHDNTEELAVEEIEHHSHDTHHHQHESEDQSEDEDSFFLTLLLESHSHDSEVEDYSEILLSLNKTIIGKDLPVIALSANQQVPKIPKHTLKKEYFEFQQDYKQEHQLLNCPLRAPPILG